MRGQFHLEERSQKVGCSAMRIVATNFNWTILFWQAETRFPFGSLVPLWSRQIPYTMAKFFFFEKVCENPPPPAPRFHALSSMQ
jgi:hypothetical protein